MERLRVRPVHLIDRAWHVFPQPDCQLEVATTPEQIERHVSALHAELEQHLADEADFLPSHTLHTIEDAAALRATLHECDVLLVNLSSSGIEGELYGWGFPVIAYSGENAPMMGLYSLPRAERQRLPHVRFALDREEVRARLRLLSVPKRLAQSKMITLGAYRCADKLPNRREVKQRLGVEMEEASSELFMQELERVDTDRARALAEEWLKESTGDAESSPEEVLEGARSYLAMERLMEDRGAQAMSVGCLEIMYMRQRAPFCHALAVLRDVGLPAGCEADAGATLTMLILDYLANRPAYMGNLVRAEPATNLVSVSHGCSPSRMHGRDEQALPYRLVHSHSAPPFSRDLEGGSGVTSYVDYGEVGQPVTIARLSADLQGLFVCGGEIVDCRDTICDRTTLTIRVEDARAYVHEATGNHQVVIYGDYVAPLRELCGLLDMECIEPTAG